MKLITAIIQPEKFKNVKDTLAKDGVTKMAVTKLDECIRIRTGERGSKAIG